MRCRNQRRTCIREHMHTLTYVHTELCANAHTRGPLAQFQRPKLREDSPAHTPTSLPKTIRCLLSTAVPLALHTLNSCTEGTFLGGLEER